MGYNFEPMIIIVCYIVVGLLVNYLFGFGTKRLMEEATESIEFVAPAKGLKHKWITLTDSNESGA